MIETNENDPTFGRIAWIFLKAIGLILWMFVELLIVPTAFVLLVLYLKCQ